jgi:hypothetical protein
MRSSRWPSIAFAFLARGARLGRLSVLLACGMLLAMVQPAAAQLVDRSHEHIVETFPGEVCGVPVTVTLDVIVNEQERLATSGFPLFKVTYRGTEIDTNPATGKSVTTFFAGTSREVSAVDNGDGTITLRRAVAGVSEAVRLSDGTLAFRDVGLLVHVTVIDYHGTLTDTSDDEVLSDSIEFVAGPHPDLESGRTLFCEVVVPALT